MTERTLKSGSRENHLFDDLFQNLRHWLVDELCTYVPRCAPGGHLDCLNIFPPKGPSTITRRSAVALVHPSLQLDDFFQNLRHWHYGDLFAGTADAVIFARHVLINLLEQVVPPTTRHRVLFRPETNSNDFGSFSNLVVAEIIFLKDSNFWCLQSSITHTMCGLFATTQFHFECFGVF